MKKARRRVPSGPLLQRMGRVAGPHQGTVILHPLRPSLQRVDLDHKTYVNRGSGPQTSPVLPAAAPSVVAEAVGPADPAEEAAVGL